MKRTAFQEILLFATSAAVGLTLYDFVIRPAISKVFTPPPQPVAGVPPQQLR